MPLPSRHCICAVLVAPVLAAMLAASATADPVADFYRGRTITLLVGAPPGGGYDTYARPVARHLGRLIPGEPTIVIKYLPAASSLAAANALYATPPHDGLTIGALQRHIPFEPLRGNKAALYDPFKMIWLGSLNAEVSITMVWSTAPHRKATDLLTVPLIAASLGAETDGEIESNAMNRLLGAQFQLVRGYPGTAQILLALEGGEVQGVHGISWSYTKTRRADWLRDGKIRILLQTSLHPHPDLKDVPSVYDLVKDDVTRQVWDAILTQKDMSRPFVLPPDVPADRVAALRNAFDRLATDAAFLEEMNKTQTEVSYVPGAEMERLIKRVYAFPPSVVARMIEAISSTEKPPVK